MPAVAAVAMVFEAVEAVAAVAAIAETVEVVAAVSEIATLAETAATLGEIASIAEGVSELGAMTDIFATAAEGFGEAAASGMADALTGGVADAAAQTATEAVTSNVVNSVAPQIESVAEQSANGLLDSAPVSQTATDASSLPGNELSHDLTQQAAQTQANTGTNLQPSGTEASQTGTTTSYATDGSSVGTKTGSGQFNATGDSKNWFSGISDWMTNNKTLVDTGMKLGGSMLQGMSSAKQANAKLDFEKQQWNTQQRNANSPSTLTFQATPNGKTNIPQNFIGGGLISYGK